GVFWTGSALNFYDGGPEIENQLALSKAVFDAGVPYLGLCWGLQIAAVAAGGTVRRNPQGREAILASGLHATEAGRTHPLLSGRSGGWSAFAVHLDEVETLPPDCTVLAHNGTSAVQAAEIRHGKGVFWGVQYHPDLDCGTMAHICRRMEPELVAEGTFVDSATTASAIDALEALHSAELEDGWPTDPDHAEKAKILGLTRDTLDAGRRRLEITNWLRAQVLPRKGQ
ncbi:MAG: type 1 glutamine amidotransferase, partial [Rhodospirillaceae bacterium]